MKPKPIAAAVSDLHLSLTQPACRADKDWMEVQAGYLRQLEQIADGLPILCAGDIFDRWNAPPELIHFALAELPNGMLCVPGQHDLPNHRMDLMHRSGYGVLAKAGKIRHLSGVYEQFEDSLGFIVHGFGWEEKIKPLSPAPGAKHARKVLHIAVIHRYCWTIGHSYPDAPRDAHLGAYSKSLRSFDVAVFGDNHKGFLSQVGPKGPNVINCGGFIRRKSDEINYVPGVGIIYSDGSIKRKTLDTSIDLFHEAADTPKEVPINMREFLDQLESLGEQGLDFREAVKRHLENSDVDNAVKQIIQEAMEIGDDRT